MNRRDLLKDSKNEQERTGVMYGRNHFPNLDDIQNYIREDNGPFAFQRDGHLLGPLFCR